MQLSGASQSRETRAWYEAFVDEKKLKLLIPIFKQRTGVVEVKVWINSGNLKVGDNIMLLLVAGRFKTDVLPVLEELLALVKNEIVTEEEAQ